MNRKSILLTNIIAIANCIASAQPAREPSLTGSWMDSKTKAKVKLHQQARSLKYTTSFGREYKGVRNGNSIRLVFKYKTIDEIPARLPLVVRQSMLRDSIVITGMIEKTQVQTEKLSLKTSTAIYNSQTGEKKRDSLISFELIRSPIQFVNKNGDPVELATDISHPNPLVEIDPVSMGHVRVNNGMATVRIKGKVKDAIADIIENGKADIKHVYFEYIDPFAEDDESARKKVSLQNQGGSSTGKDYWKPFPFDGRFEDEISFPLWGSKVNVFVKATNIAGHTGFDSFTISVDDKGNPAGVVNNEGSDPGYFNPLMIKIYDPAPPSVESSGIEDVQLMNGSKIQLEVIPGEPTGAFRAELPVIALYKPAISGIPNLLSANVSGADSKIKYGKFDEDLYWSYTTHSPPNYFKYAGGTTVNHEVRSNLFNQWELTGVSPLRETRSGGLESDDFISTRIRAELPGGDGLAPGYVIELVIQPEAGLIGAGKKLRLSLKGKGNNRQATEESELGAFKVIYRMKLVLVTVDGLGFNAIDTLMNNPSATVIPTFKKVFEGGYNLDRAGLSAIPTITWCNWPGIFSVQPPKDHGVIGNAFFERKKPGAEPFGCGTSSKMDLPRFRGTIWAGIDATLGKLVDHAKPNSGSLYDRVATAYNRGGKTWIVSVHQWYHKSDNGKVSKEVLYYPGLGQGKRNAIFSEHSERGARLLDRISGKAAAEKFSASSNMLDIVTVYFPGPDNIAHAIGQTSNVLTGAYKPGPAIPNDKTPLYALSEHLQLRTDGHLKKLVDSIESQGYLYATLFALTADHGLHAFHNSANFNITLEGGLSRFFETMRYNVWKTDTVINTSDGVQKVPENIALQNIVYAPNGGMAHIYIRSEGRTWKVSPAKRDIDSVARDLYIESRGGAYRDLQTGAIKTYPQPLRYPVLWPKANPALNGTDNGALGNPAAIFAKICDEACINQGKNHFEADFKWVKFVDPTTRAVQYGTIAEFIQARKTIRNAAGQLLYPGFEWPEFEQRLNELNDKTPDGSITGDIVIFTDGYAGYMTINDGEELNGWHGGASESESYIPLFFNIPGTVVKEDFIATALQSEYQRVRGQGRQRLRNWDLGNVLSQILQSLYR